MDYGFYIWFVGFYTVFFFAFSPILVSFLKSHGPILKCFLLFGLHMWVTGWLHFMWVMYSWRPHVMNFNSDSGLLILLFPGESCRWRHVTRVETGFTVQSTSFDSSQSFFLSNILLRHNLHIVKWTNLRCATQRHFYICIQPYVITYIRIENTSVTSESSLMPLSC